MMAKRAMLFDASRCTACRGCQAACKQWNDLEGWNYSHTSNTGSYQNPPDLSPQTWTLISFQEYEQDNKLDWLFLNRGCFHCREAVCVDVCPPHALKHDPDLNIVTYERDLCIGCGLCAKFCPFEVPRLETADSDGKVKSSKCVLCQDRVTEGLLPACVQTCTAGALLYGDFDDMVALGKARVEAVKDQHPNANLYGSDILGGLGRLYVLLEDPEVYGLPKEPKPMAKVPKVWQDILQPLANVSFGGFGVLGVAALGFIIQRRNMHMK